MMSKFLVLFLAMTITRQALSLKNSFYKSTENPLTSLLLGLGIPSNQLKEWTSISAVEAHPAHPKHQILQANSKHGWLYFTDYSGPECSEREAFNQFADVTFQCYQSSQWRQDQSAMYTCDQGMVSNYCFPSFFPP
jgi:hypothetical protein